MIYRAIALAGAISVAAAPCSADEPLSVSTSRLTMESALRVAQGAVAACRKQGIQIAAVVVDRGGHPQVVLRDTVAPDLTLEIARQKAYTALSFGAATSQLGNRGSTAGGLGSVDGLMFGAGGLTIEAGGILYGAIGVSGAPGGDLDERCAQAGVDTVLEDLEMAGF